MAAHSEVALKSMLRFNANQNMWEQFANFYNTEQNTYERE